MPTSTKPWTGRCQRCDKKTGVHTMSKFNTDLICMGCSDAEKRMPEYNAACAAEAEAIRQGDYNFPGIGLPQKKECDEADIWS